MTTNDTDVDTQEPAESTEEAEAPPTPTRARRPSRSRAAPAEGDDATEPAEGDGVTEPATATEAQPEPPAEPEPEGEAEVGTFVPRDQLAEGADEKAGAGDDDGGRPHARANRHRPPSRPEESRAEPAAGGGDGRQGGDRARPKPPRPDRQPRQDRTEGASETTTDEPKVDLPGIDALPDEEPQPAGRRRRRRRRRGGGEGIPQGEPVVTERDHRDAVPCKGILDILPEGYGFLRCSGYTPGDDDVYVSTSQVRRFMLRKGDMVDGFVRPAREGEKYPALLRITTVNEMDPADAQKRPRFENLTPLFPDERLPLEIAGSKDGVAQRIIDLISPVGKGQRGLIVSPPKAGKTTIMKQICQSIEANNPEVTLMVLLVDERPEEVTDMQRSVGTGEVIYSTFDRPSDEHTQVAEVTIERAKRLVEMGKDVVIMLDGITRLARAYNLATPASGRILSGGVDSTALYPPKRFFGAARNIEEGGSLTILATALVETGSRMDEVIFEEFKGTGNWELRLDRRLSERRIYPALDIEASGTRKEELLFSKEELAQVWKLRRVMHALDSGAALELLVDKIKSTKSNDAFLTEIAKTAIT